jgi:hypothetical protein
MPRIFGLESATGLNYFDAPVYRVSSGRDFGVIEYRAYIVGHDGHLSGFTPLVCVDDTEAIDRAKRLVDGHDVELWSGARFVIVLKHKPE